MPLRHLHHSLLRPNLQTSSSPVKSVIEHSLPEPDYFDHIDELQIWAVTRKNLEHNFLTNSSEARSYHARRATSNDRPKLLVCHDFKGGYTEDPFERGYSFEFWNLVDTFIYFSHNRVTIPPRGWLEAGRRHGSKVLGTVIFEWAESKPDLQKCLYGEKLNSTQQVADCDSSPLSFSTEYASHLITLAQSRKIDGYLLNIETDLNFIPPISSYPGGTLTEQKEDIEFLVREKNLAGFGKLISPDVRSRRVQRMHKNAESLAGWVGWLREEGKKRIGPHWEIIWYDSVTTAGNLEWQDALTPANIPFFMKSDAIFTNYTWARPPDPSPPGALPSPARPTFEQHPALLKSAHNANSLSRPTNEVYMGIDVFGRNCYGGFSIGSSLDMIFPSRRSTREETSHEPHSRPDGNAKQSDLGLSVALFAPGWTWEREKEGGGERSWNEWWMDELRFWYGPATADIHLLSKEPVPAAVGAFFGPRERSLVRHPLTQSASTLSPLMKLERTDAPAENSLIDRNEHRSQTFFTNFNRGSGNSWWVRGHRVYEALFDSGSPTEKRGWTDMGTCFPKPDRIWPRPTLLNLEIDSLGFGNVVNSQIPDKLAVKTALVDYDVWEGGSSLEIQLEKDPLGAQDRRPTEDSGSSENVLPLCTLHASHVTSSGFCTVEIIMKRVSDFGEAMKLEGLNLRPCIIWSDNESSGGMYRAVQAPSSPARISELVNGWYRILATIHLAGDISRLSVDVVPVVAVEFDWSLPPSGTHSTSSTDLKLLVGAIFVTGDSSQGPDDPASSLLEIKASSNNVMWNPVPRPSGAPSGTVWGFLTWNPSEEESSVTTGYYNVFASRKSPEEMGSEATRSDYVWLGTSTYELDPNSFVVAGLQLSDMAMMSRPGDRSVSLQAVGSGDLSVDTPQQIFFMVERVGSTGGVRSGGVRYTCRVDIE